MRLPPCSLFCHVCFELYFYKNKAEPIQLIVNISYLLTIVKFFVMCILNMCFNFYCVFFFVCHTFVLPSILWILLHFLYLFCVRLSYIYIITTHFLCQYFVIIFLRYSYMLFLKITLLCISYLCYDNS